MRGVTPVLAVVLVVTVDACACGYSVGASVLVVWGMAPEDCFRCKMPLVPNADPEGPLYEPVRGSYTTE